MDSLHDTCIHDIAKTAERCCMGFEALYQQTKLSVGQHFCTTPDSLFSQKVMEDHISDADDEITDVSGECLSSSNEFCDVPKDYYISSGTKPLSLVIRRFSTPTINNNSPTVLKRDSNVSSPFTREFESTSCSEVLNSDNKVNDLLFQKEGTITSNAISPPSQESHIVLGPTALEETVGALQEVILRPFQQSNYSVITQENIENVVNDVHVKIKTTHTIENGHLKYVADSTLQQSNPLLEKYSNEDVDGKLSVSSVCSREVCQRVRNDSIDDRIQALLYPLGSSKTIQSLIHTHPSEHCKQVVELSNDSSFGEVLGENAAGNIIKIAEDEGCQEMNAMDTTRCESKIANDVILNTNSFHIRKEHSESAEKMCNLNLKTQCEPCCVGGKSLVKSSMSESLINEVYEAEGIAIVNKSFEFESSEAVLLQVQGGNITESGNKVSTIVIHDVEVAVGQNAFDEDYTVCTGKCEHEKTEVSFSGSETAMGTTTDTVKSEKHIEIACEPIPLQNIDNTSQEIEIKMPEDASIINVIRNATVSMSPTSVGCSLSSIQAEKSENSHLMICTQSRQTVSVDDSPVQKCGHSAFYDMEELITESSMGSSPKSSIPLIGMNGVLITGESEKVQPVNVKAEDVKSMECSSVLAGELAENVVASADFHRDRFYKVSKTDHLQSSVRNSSLLVRSYTEDKLDCYNDLSSDTVFVKHSPLLFSSDDENSYYTERISNEQETSATISNYDEIMTTEQKKLHRLQEALLGVPPPPSITIPQLDVTDILRLLKENKSLMILADTESEAGSEAVKSQAAPLKQSTAEQIKNYSWPDSKSCCHYGIQYNRGGISEEFEILCQKLQERYVGSETTSSCNIWFNCDISNKVSNITSRHRSAGHSPGRRLSHLARRRQTFSCANLLNGSVADSRHSAAAERRLIMVEIKKAEHRQRLKNYQPHKKVPSVDCNQLQKTKRALFKSPPGNRKGVSSASKSRSGLKKNKSDIDQTRARNSKRALWPSEDNATVKTGRDRALTSLTGQINVYGKRRREEGVMSAQRKCPRRMLFGGASAAVKGESDFMTADDSSQNVRTSENKPQMSVSRDLTGGLSEVHRKKLLWAVAEVLRGEGISMNHPLFRPYATSLVRLVRNVMPDLNCKRAVSTSDLMLQLAKEHIKDVMEQQNGETKILYKDKAGGSTVIIFCHQF